MNQTDEALVQALMHDIDRTLLRQNLKLTPAQRLKKFTEVARFSSELQRAGETIRRRGAQAAKK